MNRTAKCIEMLVYLSEDTENYRKAKDVADYLNTNPRNIREFKRELESAGFGIEEKKGRYGGYRLKDKKLVFVSV
ncbi:MAG: Rrf2 family transcriptional regulator [Holdemanella sp.]|nr:Rrf2 family transcriptional regulator [Holdemanella sp.]